jgi:hypothetical protein
VDWTALATASAKGQRRWRRGYTLRYPNISEDQQLLSPSLDQLLPRIYGDGWHRYDMPFHSCRMSSQGYFPFTDRVKFPIVEQPGSSNEGGLGENPYSFRLLFFRGLRLSEAEENYVMASSDATDYAGNPTGELSLELSGPDSLYENNLKGIPELLADGTPITKYIELGIGDITLLRNWSNSRRKIFDPDGEFVGIIKQIEFKPTPTGIGLAKVDFIKQP